MTTHTVTRIIDGDTFEVSPMKNFNGRSFSKIRPAGFDAREIGQYGAITDTNKLTRLIYGKQVQLDSIKQSYDRLLCKVWVSGKPLPSLVK